MGDDTHEARHVLGLKIFNWSLSEVALKSLHSVFLLHTAKKHLKSIQALYDFPKLSYHFQSRSWKLRQRLELLYYEITNETQWRDDCLSTIVPRKIQEDPETSVVLESMIFCILFVALLNRHPIWQLHPILRISLYCIKIHHACIKRYAHPSQRLSRCWQTDGC